MLCIALGNLFWMKLRAQDSFARAGLFNFRNNARLALGN